jgi:Metallo-peptidase family M12
MKYIPLILLFLWAINCSAQFTCETFLPEKTEVEPIEYVIERSDKVVKIYMEADYDLYVAQGSDVVVTTNFVTSLFGEVQKLYLADGINLELSEVKVNTVVDPYIGPSAGEYLSQFRTALGGNFNGDLAHLVGTKGGGGVAYVDVLCNKTVGMGYSHIFPSYYNVPQYSWSVQVIAHEIGHNLGSYHTHSCVWNGNNTALDGCGTTAGYGEGCDAPLPTNGGTIMSYCHLLSSIGINFNNGFGEQPANRMKSRIANAACLGGNTNEDDNEDDDCVPTSCGNNKVLVCHNGNLICINHNALPAHIGHGDTLIGCEPCGMTSPQEPTAIIVYNLLGQVVKTGFGRTESMQQLPFGLYVVLSNGVAELVSNK